MSKPISKSREPTLDWLLDQADKYLITRLSPNRLSSLKKLESEDFSRIVHEIERVILLFNAFPSSINGSGLDPHDYQNALHLKSLFPYNIPRYQEIINRLAYDQSLLDAVFSELRDSDYFREVYLIDTPKHLLVNLMILLYRNSFLTIHPELRQGGAQISSTLEEMAAADFLAGNDSLLLRGTKYWLQDWLEEGFSEKLSLKITKSNYGP